MLKLREKASETCVENAINGGLECLLKLVLKFILSCYSETIMVSSSLTTDQGTSSKTSLPLCYSLDATQLYTGLTMLFHISFFKRKRSKVALDSTTACESAAALGMKTASI